MSPIIALDFPTLRETTAFLAPFAGVKPLTVKIGMELFYGVGPRVVSAILHQGNAAVFLDLKLHDIPHTVERAAYQIGRLGVQLTTAHAAGGSRMLAAAKRGLVAGAAAAGLPAPKLLAITQLTSTSDTMLHNELQVSGSVGDSVQHLAVLAQTAGADGVVASAREAQLIRAVTRSDFLIVTPGIRPAGSQKGIRFARPRRRKLLNLAVRQLCSGGQSPKPLTHWRRINKSMKNGDGPMTEIETTIATDLLTIGAVTLRPKDPFTWASGIHSPIYTDNRLTISYPAVRTRIADGLAQLIKTQYPDVQVIGGVATAGIPHAALVAERLNLPLVYVRSKPKDHGQGRQIEGKLGEKAKLVLIDDLLSTGGSVLKAAVAARREGADVIGVAAIFSYQLPALTTNFAAAKTPFVTLTNYTALIQTAQARGLIDADELNLLHAWRKDPTHWQA